MAAGGIVHPIIGLRHDMATVTGTDMVTDILATGMHPCLPSVHVFTTGHITDPDTLIFTANPTDITLSARFTIAMVVNFGGYSKQKANRKRYQLN